MPVIIDYLHHLARSANTGALPTAYGARYSVLALFAELQRRQAWLTSMSKDKQGWHRIVSGDLGPVLESAMAHARRKCARIGLSFTAPLPTRQCTLSPVDLGFHRVLKRHDDSLAFLGFEGFGWDDPVRVTSDILWNTEMTLSPGERTDFAAGLGLIYGDDPGFMERLPVLFPLHGLRWVMRVIERDICTGRGPGRAGAMLGDVRTALEREISGAGPEIAI